MSVDLESLRRVSVPLDGIHRELRLDLPRAGTLLPLIHDPAVRDANLAEEDLLLELIQIVELDGRRLDKRVLRELLHRPDALATLLVARNRLYDTACEQGLARVACPTCGREMELQLAAFAFLLHARPWDLFERGVLPAAPRLAGELLRGARPRGVPLASSIAFELPAAQLGIARPADAVRGVLGPIGPADEQAAWARWAPPDGERPEGRTWWRPRHPGFRAVLRLTVALRRLEQPDGRAIEPTPEAVERLYMADIHFLDLLYSYACLADASNDAAIVCPSCSTSFSPAL
jgi:hypothetical protein